MVCPACSAQLDDRSSFCSSCGTPQARPAGGGPAGVSPPAPAPGWAPQNTAAPAQDAAGALWGAPAADSAAQPSPAAAPPAAVRHSLKTSADTVCGVFFLLLGGGALGVYGFYLAGIAAAPAPLHALLPLLGGFTTQALAATFVSLGHVLGLGAGPLLVLAGLFALKSGKGHKPAYAGLVLMLFVLLCDVLYYSVMVVWGHISPPLGPVLLQGVFIYVFQCVFAAALLVLLPVKRAAKKRRKRRLAALAPAAAPAGTLPGQRPADIAAALAAPREERALHRVRRRQARAGQPPKTTDNA